MEITMDRRQRKSRQAIFSAFIALLAKKDFSQITVGEIIESADIGRATFYSHFETKDYLLKELCGELFCHILDAADNEHTDHRHIFECDDHESVFLHLFRHIAKNDNNLLLLLSCPNNELFLRYFETELRHLVVRQRAMFESRKSETLPDSFWTDHIASTFTQTVRWWIANGMKQSPETITEYFRLAV